MSYTHIHNLYRPEAQAIWELRRVAVSEKVDGTGALITFQDGAVQLSSGAASCVLFESMLAPLDLKSAFERLGHPRVSVFGEAYGGKIARMRDTYGDKLQFAVFEVRVDDTWLSQSNAEDVAGKLGLEFVPWRIVPCDIASIDAERDRPSEIAVRRGITEPKKREGVIIKSVIELVKSNGERLIAKHKNPEWAERATQPDPVSPEKLIVLSDARAVADEWVNDARLDHALQHLAEAGTPATSTRDVERVIAEVLADVLREAAGEISDTREVRRAICASAGKLYIARVKSDRA